MMETNLPNLPESEANAAPANWNIEFWPIREVAHFFYGLVLVVTVTTVSVWSMQLIMEDLATSRTPLSDPPATQLADFARRANTTFVESSGTAPQNILGNYVERRESDPAASTTSVSNGAAALA